MGTFTHEPTVLAIYGGLWKGVAAGGVAVQFGMAAAKVSYRYVYFVLSRGEFANFACANRAQIAFALAPQVLSIPIMLVLMMRARETNYTAEGMLLSRQEIITRLHQKRDTLTVSFRRRYCSSLCGKSCRPI